MPKHPRQFVDITPIRQPVKSKCMTEGMWTIAQPMYPRLLSNALHQSPHIWRYKPATIATHKHGALCLTACLTKLVCILPERLDCRWSNAHLTLLRTFPKHRQIVLIHIF